jgi:dipeptidase
LFDVAPTSKVTDGLTLNAGDSLNIQVTVTSGKDIDFSVNDGSTTYLSYSNVTTVNKDWTVPQSSNYNFVFNSSSTFTSKDVTWQVTKHWTETAYRDVTQNVQLLPLEFSYVGIVLSLAGIGILIYGTVKKKLIRIVNKS